MREGMRRTLAGRDALVDGGGKRTKGDEMMWDVRGSSR
jgi:hypothetical protein